MTKKAVILCGGLATRFLPFTKSIPKEMLPIVNRPAIDYCIEDLRNNGITDILVILGRGKECLETYYDRNVELESRLEASGKQTELQELNKIYDGVNISFMRQINARGTGYAVSLAKNFVGEDSFVLMFPDEIVLGDSITKQLIFAHERTQTSILPLKRIDVKDCSKYGMVEFKKEKKDYKIKSIVEKPDIKDCPSDMCYTGGGLFTKDIFEHLEKCKMHPNGEIYLTDAFQYLIANDALYGVEVDGLRLDFGTPIGFIKGNILAGLNRHDTREELVEFLRTLKY